MITSGNNSVRVLVASTVDTCREGEILDTGSIGYILLLVFLISGDYQSFTRSVEIYNPHSSRTCHLGFSQLQHEMDAHSQCGAPPLICGNRICMIMDDKGYFNAGPVHLHRQRIGHLCWDVSKERAN